MIRVRVSLNAYGQLPPAGRAARDRWRRDPFARHVLPLFDQATEACIVAAFVQESGLARVRPAVHGALARGANVRILTGDYLDIAQASALELLLDWQRAYAGNDSEEDAPAGCFAARVIEVAALPGRTRSFHPKSWLFAAQFVMEISASVPSSRKWY